MDWCSSGFTSPSTTESSLRISVMYERSSRVWGSMIWYSSSMPIVRLGGFMVSSLLDHERRHRRTAAGRHVHQRIGGHPRKAAVHPVHVVGIWSHVHDPAAEM